MSVSLLGQLYTTTDLLVLFNVQPLSTYTRSYMVAAPLIFNGFIVKFCWINILLSENGEPSWTDYSILYTVVVRRNNFDQ